VPWTLIPPQMQQQIVLYTSTLNGESNFFRGSFTNSNILVFWCSINLYQIGFTMRLVEVLKFALASTISWSYALLFEFENWPTLGTKIGVLPVFSCVKFKFERYVAAETHQHLLDYNLAFIHQKCSRVILSKAKEKLYSK
jgi:hypothetical protein